MLKNSIKSLLQLILSFLFWPKSQSIFINNDIPVTATCFCDQTSPSDDWSHFSNRKNAGSLSMAARHAKKWSCFNMSINYFSTIQNFSNSLETFVFTQLMKWTCFGFCILDNRKYIFCLFLIMILNGYCTWGKIMECRR